jgi:hypothetical protein
LATSGADEGYYVVTATADRSANASFTLDADDDLQPQEGTGTIFSLPGGLAYTHTTCMPLVEK